MAPAPSAAAGTASSHPATIAPTTANSFFMSFSCALASLHVRLNAATRRPTGPAGDGLRPTPASTVNRENWSEPVGLRSDNTSPSGLRGGWLCQGRGAARAKGQGQADRRDEAHRDLATEAATAIPSGSPLTVNGSSRKNAPADVM